MGKERRHYGHDHPLRRLLQGLFGLLLGALASWLAGKITSWILGPAEETPPLLEEGEE